MSESPSAGKRVKAQVLSGFRDQLPAQMILRRALIERFRRVFEAHGFEPIDTPALEYLEVLTGKAGENEKLMYHFTDHGGREVGLRYDLTVPLARYVANHQNELPLPFKRYHIAPVWRAEKAQRGRFREFYQCDADIVGSPATIADAEAISMVGEILTAAGLPEFSVSISHRQLLAGIARVAGIAPEHATVVYRTVDKLHKIGADAVRAELVAAGATEDSAAKLMDMITRTGTNEQILDDLRPLASNDSELTLALDQLAELFALLSYLAPGAACFRLDLTLARGLDYYTGIVYEATVEKPRIGSVSGGGRYDGLVGAFAGRHIPAVGISIGLERILEVATEFELVQPQASVAQAIVIFSEGELDYAAGVARALRADGINVDLSLMVRRSFGDQLKYAERRGIPVAVIAGEAERINGMVNVKVLGTGEQLMVPGESAPAEVRSRLPEFRGRP